jgi:hypothetical protein
MEPYLFHYRAIFPLRVMTGVWTHAFALVNQARYCLSHTSAHYRNILMNDKLIIVKMGHGWGIVQVVESMPSSNSAAKKKKLAKMLHVWPDIVPRSTL